MSEPNVKQAVPLFGVGDIKASARFYVEGMGFNMSNSWTPDGKLRWCWLDLGNAAVMLQEFWKDADHSNTPTSKVGVGISINFICSDALSIYREFKSRGIEVARPFVGNGMWVTGVTDPDGYQLYFESPTDVAEETLFADEE
ncbi:MAG TPA: VOC family protein [Gemmatimonadaceae bacterium]|nr:VOC family protein [Gemmatimonadaceae bacterium]